MLLSCPSCISKYLVNSANLKPKGRNVKCAKCGYEWFQQPNLIEEEKLTSFSSQKSLNQKNVKERNKPFQSNLPSTVIVNQKPSITNSISVVVLLLAFIFLIWFIRSNGYGIIALVNFYIQEFNFNIKLIINDFAKIIYHIIN